MYCICINCKYLKECAAYHKVESKHDERHLNEYPSFYPDHPIVNILLLNNSTIPVNTIFKGFSLQYLSM